MSEAQLPSVRVAQARELFFGQGRDPAPWITPHISRSWQRSRPIDAQYIDPEPMALALLSERREQAMRLLNCAQPELDGLAEHAVGNGCVVILSDASGLILEEIGSPDFLPKAERIALQPGVAWSENHRGTNAIGTALAEREALMVLGGEHYLAQNGALGCAAAPIFTGRGELAGALDISGETARVNHHALGLVRMAAQQVEHRMMLAEASGHVLRFHARPALIGTAREGLMVIEGGRIVAANRVALELFDRSWEGLLDLDAQDFLGANWPRMEHRRSLLTLPGGRQIATVMERSTAPGGSRTAGRRTHAPTGTAAAPEADDVLPLLERAVRVLNEGVPVLVNGETGSGKEVFSRRLHAASRRSTGPFVAVDCASLPETLIESELFGYEEGAFTGAKRKGMAGRIREAHGGVLFLDEIAEIPLALQTRLLRVLEERVVTPLGGGQGVAVDFDLVCATHGDLPALVKAGRFRADLMYRVAGFGVSLPSLNRRADRHALITRLFLESGGAAKHLRLESDALEALAAYRWPGNVRELRSTLRAIVALSNPGDSVHAPTLPAHLHGTAPSQPQEDTAIDARPAQQHTAEPLVAITRHAIDEALKASDHDVARAARRLGVHRSTIYRHLARQRGKPTDSMNPSTFAHDQT
ncbi:sigma-54-dependent Fis family transcriptional regulator [Variovorax sp. PAMC26660]|uniref:sigma-54-dependent Fis family transcriptional regulator n=1 Tax=Variovorax sp. PAMC26660 TaxID=2762322 RepID=UPI00164E27B0|nr:sigma-54-dependent Fis family transcriptional regulator [Variovorax sp. PAMC26660]QNK66402.1 sigma-54-dependent Fis family transcriptional regulator [Variovorax sp. PAMC26660]